MRSGYRNHLLYILICFLSLFGLKPNALEAQTKNQTNDSRVSILTVSKGDDAASIFGHSAIRVKGLNGAKDIIYNYGTYSFEQPNFLLNFLKGRLLYSLSTQSYGPFLKYYHSQQRSITEQTLNLTQEQEARIIHSLAVNYRLENREYLYEFFFDNCCTRLRDVIEMAYDGNLEWMDSAPRYTFRELLHQYTDSNTWLSFGIDLLIGSRTDDLATQQEEMFLPDYLMEHLKYATLKDGSHVISREEKVIDFTHVEEIRNQPETKWLLYFMIFLLLIECLIFYRVYTTHVVSKSVLFFDRIWYLIIGIGGLILGVMWVLTDHYSTKGNWNILWLSPLLLGLLRRYKTSKVLNAMVILVVVIGGIGLLQSAKPVNLAFFPMMGIIILKSLRNLRQKEQQQ